MVNPNPFPYPMSMVDVVILSVLEGELQVLLVRRPAGEREPFPGAWALPGGFVDTAKDQSLEHCALRKLKEKTGISSPYLEQVGSWGGAHRDPRGWSTTHVYFALLPIDASPLQPGGNATDIRWSAVNGEKVREKLAFDHPMLLKHAIQRLRAKVEYTSLPAFLMPREFTLTELQRMYEVVLGRELEKKAFRTRMLSAGFLEPLSKQKEGSNRPAQLFRLRDRSNPIFFARTFGR